MHDVETVIVGAGVIGLAIARSLAMAGQDVVVLEQHGLIGSETSARNSEVIHAGIYYPKDSLKALTCVEGKQRLYEFCATHNVPHKRLGKLIVATDQSQEETLDGILHHAVQNGVHDLTVLNQAEVHLLEPELNALAALYSPSTGIIDSHAYMLALQGDAEAYGAQIAFNTSAASWSALPGGGFQISCQGEETTQLTTTNLIVSGGLDASRFLSTSVSELKTPVKPTRYAKGNYFRLAGRAPFSHLIYPVPEPGGLGVHLTLDIGGQARFGPDVEWVETLDYAVDPSRSEGFNAAIRSYWPGLPDAALEPDYAGIRPKLTGPGEANADFEIWGENRHGLPGLIALLGIESPGLTASLAIADRVRALL